MLKLYERFDRTAEREETPNPLNFNTIAALSLPPLAVFSSSAILLFLKALTRHIFNYLPCAYK